MQRAVEKATGVGYEALRVDPQAPFLPYFLMAAQLYLRSLAEAPKPQEAQRFFCMW